MKSTAPAITQTISICEIQTTTSTMTMLLLSPEGEVLWRKKDPVVHPGERDVLQGLRTALLQAFSREIRHLWVTIPLQCSLNSPSVSHDIRLDLRLLMDTFETCDIEVQPLLGNQVREMKWVSDTEAIAKGSFDKSRGIYRTYNVNIETETCTCMDFRIRKRRAGGWCKHLRQAMKERP